MCLAQGPQRSDAGEARTRGPSVSSQALYHCADGESSRFIVINSGTHQFESKTPGALYVALSRTKSAG